MVKWKFGNVESLIGSLADYEDDPDTVNPSLFDYLSRVALASRDDRRAREPRRTPQGRVNLMTIHAAKGLEFPVVFVAAVEKDIIPHIVAIDGGGRDAERRGGAPAVLRGHHQGPAQAVPELVRLAPAHGQGRCEAFPSPFLDELPPDCLSTPSAGYGAATAEGCRAHLRRGAQRRSFLTCESRNASTCRRAACGCAKGAAAA